MNRSKINNPLRWTTWIAAGAVESLNSAKRRSTRLDWKKFGDPQDAEVGNSFDVMVCDGRTTMSHTLWYQDPGLVSDYTKSGTVTRRAVRDARKNFDGESFTIRLVNSNSYANNGAGSGVSSVAHSEPLDLNVKHACASAILDHLEALFAP